MNTYHQPFHSVKGRPSTDDILSMAGVVNNTIVVPANKTNADGEPLYRLIGLEGEWSMDELGSRV